MRITMQWPRLGCFCRNGLPDTVRRLRGCNQTMPPTWLQRYPMSSWGHLRSQKLPLRRVIRAPKAWLNDKIRLCWLCCGYFARVAWEIGTSIWMKSWERITQRAMPRLGFHPTCWPEGPKRLFLSPICIRSSQPDHLNLMELMWSIFLLASKRFMTWCVETRIRRNNVKS